MDNGKQRLAGLDGLRALAIGLVLLDHSLLHFDGGGLGVNVFFVLSGFLITALLIRERERTGTIRLGMFYGRRALRLYPALLTMLAVTLLLGTSAKFALLAATYTTDIYNAVTTHGTGAYQHTWSLGLEEQFYLLWPLSLPFAIALGRRRAVWILGLAAVASVVVGWLGTQTSHPTDAAFNPLWQAHGLIIGCMLALLLSSGIRVPRPTATLATGTVVVLVVVLAASIANSARMAADWNLLAELGTAMVIAGMVAGGRAGWYRSPVAKWIGERSYGIYLWHFPLLVLALHHSIGPATVSRLVFPSVFTVPLSIGAAAVSYRWVERPFLRLKDRLHPGTSRDSAPLRANKQETARLLS